MGTFRVPFTFTATIYIEVEAVDKEEAIDKAYEEISVGQFVGNGGNDKLIGVYDSNHSIEPGEDFEVQENSVEQL